MRWTEERDAISLLKAVTLSGPPTVAPVSDARFADLRPEVVLISAYLHEQIVAFLEQIGANE